MKICKINGVRWTLVTMLSLWLALCLAVPVWGEEIDYHGTYTGTFDGGDNGIWVAAIGLSTLGDVVFLSYSATNGGDGGYLTFDDTAETGTLGTYRGESFIYPGNDIAAVVDSDDGSVNGTWSGVSGDTIEGQKITSCPYDGEYAGALTGDSTGSWIMTIAPNCYIRGVVTIGGNEYEFEGGATSGGAVLAAGDAEGDYFFLNGSISGDDMSGSWESTSGDSGVFNTSVAQALADGGGSSGCFINSLIGD